MKAPHVAIAINILDISRSHRQVNKIYENPQSFSGCCGKPGNLFLDGWDSTPMLWPPWLRNWMAVPSSGSFTSTGRWSLREARMTRRKTMTSDRNTLVPRKTSTLGGICSLNFLVSQEWSYNCHWNIGRYVVVDIGWAVESDWWLFILCLWAIFSLSTP